MQGNTFARTKLQRADIRVRVYTHTRARAYKYVRFVRGARERCVRRYTEYLALSIQRKGITYYRQLPARRAFIYCYPVRISLARARQKENIPSQPPAASALPSSRDFHPLLFVDRMLYIRKIIVRFNNVFLPARARTRPTPALSRLPSCNIAIRKTLLVTDKI